MAHFWCFLDDKFETFFIFCRTSLWTLNRVIFIDGRQKKDWHVTKHNLCLPVKHPSKAIWSSFFTDFYGFKAITFWFNRKKLPWKDLVVRRSLLPILLTAIIISLLSLSVFPSLPTFHISYRCLINLSCAEPPECEHSIEKANIFTSNYNWLSTAHLWNFIEGKREIVEWKVQQEALIQSTMLNVLLSFLLISSWRVS